MIRFNDMYYTMVLEFVKEKQKNFTCTLQSRVFPYHPDMGVISGMQQIAQRPGYFKNSAAHVTRGGAPSLCALHFALCTSLKA